MHRTGCITSGVLALPAYLKKNNYRNPADGSNCAFQLGFNTDLHFFNFLQEKPAHAIEFNNHMTVYHQGRPSWMDPGFYPVTALAEGTNIGSDDVLIVDMGGSMGHDLSEFRRKWRDLPGRLVLQDLPAVVEQAKTTKLDPAIELTVHDFFTEQPVKGTIHRPLFEHRVVLLTDHFRGPGILHAFDPP